MGEHYEPWAAVTGGAHNTLRDELADLLAEWQKTCNRMDIPFTMADAVQFADDAEWFNRYADAQVAAEREANIATLREAASSMLSEVGALYYRKAADLLVAWGQP
jgi:hypothetical protein